MTKFEIMLQKLLKWQKIDYKVRAGRPISWPQTPILNFLMSTGSNIPFEKLRSRLYVVLSQKWWPKLKLYFKIAKICQKSAKNSQNLPLSDQEIPNFEFSHRFHYSHTLEDTYEHILGSFQPKLMTKFEVMLQKLQKWQKIDYKVRAGKHMSWPQTPILNFLMSTGSHIPFKKLRSRLLEVFSQN